MKILAAALFCGSVTAVWPIPAQYSSGDTTLLIDQSVRFHYIGPYQTRAKDLQHQHGHSARAPRQLVTSEDVVQTAIERTKQDLFKKNLVPWMFHGRGQSYEPQRNGAKTITDVTLKQLSPDIKNFHKAPAGDVDESYQISIDKSASATITAKSSIGISRGLTTFSQLFYAFANGDDAAWTKSAPFVIRDEPKFAHRGLNLDTSRHFMGVKAIMRTIDAMAFNKFNRLHLHITDSQSWPLEIPSMPDLAKKGAYRPDMVYSVQDFQDIQHHAALQGIEVITEIDSPGHTASVAYSMPDLIAAFDVQPGWAEVALEPPAGTLKLNSSAVYNFMEKLYSDLLPRVRPFTSYFHSGGDEVTAAAYLRDNTVNSKDKSVLKPLMQKFVDRNHEQIRKAGLTPVVWEEMLLEWDLDLGKDVVVQTWQSDDALAQSVAKGHKALAGNYHYWYLDCGRGQWLDFPPGKGAADAWPYEDYCAPLKNWRLIYSYDPLSGIPKDKQKLVLGGEVHLWAEMTDRTNLDKMLWPRAAAAGEVLWSGAKDAGGQNRSQVEASPRLYEMRERLLRKGVMAEPMQMPYCSMYPNSCIFHG